MITVITNDFKAIYSLNVFNYKAWSHILHGILERLFTDKK